MEWWVQFMELFVYKRFKKWIPEYKRYKTGFTCSHFVKSSLQSTSNEIHHHDRLLKKKNARKQTLISVIKWSQQQRNDERLMLVSFFLTDNLPPIHFHSEKRAHSLALKSIHRPTITNPRFNNIVLLYKMQEVFTHSMSFIASKKFLCFFNTVSSEKGEVRFVLASSNKVILYSASH